MHASGKQNVAVAGFPVGAAPSDTEVVARVCAGDVELFEVLMRRHNRRVYRAIRSVLREEADVEDAMQEAYVSAFQHLDQYQGSAAFSTWLVRIAYNTALARVRARRPLTTVSDEREENTMLTSADVPEPERRASAREAAVLLERALDTLPELYRTVFVLREVEEMDTAECAGVLGVSEDVVKTRLHRARGALRERLLQVVGQGAGEAFHFEAPRCDRVVAGVFARLRSGRP
jgi:RNA polymerase sigma-70 factor (ECF subfamily)